MDAEQVTGEIADWQMAFRWLAAHELAVGLYVPVQEQFLRQRTKTLAILFNLLPRAEAFRFPEVITAWAFRFRGQTEVSLAQLRQTAREILTEKNDPQGADDLWQRAIQLSHWSVDVPGVPLQQSECPPDISQQGQRHCAEGLFRWFRELRSSPHWNTLPGIVPGEANRPLDEVYVDLHAIEESEVVQNGDVESGGRDLQAGRGPRLLTITVETMVTRTIERCIVVGDPGSGKSTLVKWLIWATFHGKLADFDLAIEIKLSAYAAAVSVDSPLTPLEFFFRSQGLGDAESTQAANALRHAANESRRHLLLLDGWDEVPVSQREALKERLLREDRAFVTLITSRPSGMPRQLLERQKVGFYRIAGLSPLIAQELTAKLLRQLGHEDRCASIWHRIQNDSHLMQLAANPFLLGLLVRSLLESWFDFVVTRAAIYRRITAWMRQHYEQCCEANAVLTPRHLEGLTELSFRLLNDAQIPRYIFTQRELETSLQEQAIEPVLRSRFVTRPNSTLDEFTALHATIQEFWAAEHLATRSSETQQEFIDRALTSASRLIVLEFLAGLGGQASITCHNAAQRWWAERDRFLQITRRVARLAVAGMWSLDDLGRSLREELWAHIAQEEDMEMCQLAVNIYAELDARDLAERVQRTPVSSWAINCLLEAIPAPIARELRLDELLTGEWRDIAGFDWMGGTTEAERKQLHRLLEQRDAAPGDLREAVMQAGASRDESFIPSLIRVSQCQSLPDHVREEAVTSIGRIGGRQAGQAIRELLLSGSAISDAMARMSSMMFVQSASQRVQLEPQGRDELLRRLAAVSPTNSRVEHFLTALEDSSIRDGAEVIAELATSSDSSLGVKRKAVSTLASVVDRRLLSVLVDRIESEPTELSSEWLNLSLTRSLPVPVPWLRNRVSRSRSRVERHQLLKALVRVIALCDTTTRKTQAEFLDGLISKAMNDDAESELATALVGALSDVQGQRIRLLSEKSRSLALQTLGQAPAGSGQQAKLLLAAAIVRHFRDGYARGVLVSTLERLHAQSDVNAHDRLAIAVADALAEIAPEELLRLPLDCPGVESVLRTRSLKEGWLVFSRRILNSEGGEIASLDQPSVSAAASGQPIALQSLLQTLPQQMRYVLESYWLMVRSSGPCHPSDSYPSIHRVLQSLHGEEDDDSDLGQILRSRFPAGFPKFAAWTKQLNHVESKFQGQPEAESFLRSLGLYRR